MAALNMYLNFNGETEEAFNFYKSIFGSEFTVLQRFKDVLGMEVPADAKDKIMHIALPVGANSVLMATDSIESMGHTFIAGNNYHLSLNTESEEEATRLFKGLSEDGNIMKDLQKTFWNAYFGMFTDKFGVQWMINYDYN